MTTKYGVFSETGHGLADPYTDTVKPDPRDHGLNFKVSIQQYCLMLLQCMVLCKLHAPGAWEAPYVTIKHSNNQYAVP
jgi:hypothetical protein